MNVQELINTLTQSCDPTAKIEMADGSEITNICYHAGQKRVSIGHEGDIVENLAPGWVYIYME